MILRALAIWFLLFAIAFGMGVLRVGLLTPRSGETAAHVVGTSVVVACWAPGCWGASRRADARSRQPGSASPPREPRGDPDVHRAAGRRYHGRAAPRSGSRS